MKKNKFILSRRALNQIYISYIRPKLEYASIIWDGCSEYCSDSLEKIQNEAARIVTGLTRSVSLEKLYQECGWESLASRRISQKLCFMYKATHDMVPTYISDIMPSTVGDISSYPLRNRNNINMPVFRTVISQNSCIPSSITLWNSLELNLRTSNSFNIFKDQMRHRISPAKQVPSYYYYGNRYLSVLHARIRNNCSNLNIDLFNNHLSQSPYCNSCNVIEDAEHFFFRCNLFTRQRLILFQSTRIFHPLSIEVILHGVSDFSTDENITIFSAVHKYINQTKRFE